MRNVAVVGYLVSAALYSAAWWRPTGGLRNDMLQWVSFSRLCLAEFLSVHAATLLAAFVFVKLDDGGSGEYGVIFWLLLAFYGALGVGAWLFHRSHRALIGFYLLLAVRVLDFISLRAPELNVVRAEVVKNFAMSVPMMLLVAVVTMSDDMLRPWQESFLKSGTFWQRIWRGKPLLVVSAYYVLWALVEAKWPERMTGN